jgi:hypothetical protein
VDLVCDKHGISGGGKHSDEHDAQLGASAAATVSDKHCEYNDVQPGRFSNGRRGRDVRYARTIINAHHVS